MLSSIASVTTAAASARIVASSLPWCRRAAKGLCHPSPGALRVGRDRPDVRALDSKGIARRPRNLLCCCRSSNGPENWNKIVAHVPGMVGGVWGDWVVRRSRRPTTFPKGLTAVQLRARPEPPRSTQIPRRAGVNRAPHQSGDMSQDRYTTTEPRGRAAQEAAQRRAEGSLTEELRPIPSLLGDAGAGDSGLPEPGHRDGSNH
jgi:hypothetical protein